MSITVPVWVVGATVSYLANPHYVHHYDMGKGLCMHVAVGLVTELGVCVSKKLVAPAASAILIGCLGGFWAGTYLVDRYVVTGKAEDYIKHLFKELEQQRKTLGRTLTLPNGNVYACLPKAKMG